MKPAPFAYEAPTTIDEAVELLARTDGDAKVLAGGQSLIPILSMRLTRFDRLVDLRRIDELRAIRRDDGSVRVGAMTLQADAEHDPELADCAPLVAAALPHVGHFQIRNRGTIGGSIAHADPAAELPAVAVALDAQVDIAGPDGRREVTAADFFLSTFMTALDDTDILTAVRFPVWEGRSGFAVEEVARRHGDFAIAGAACGITLDGDAVAKAAIGMFGVDSTPLRASAAEDSLTGSRIDDLDLDEIGRIAAQHLDPPDDLHASSALRREVGATVVTRAIHRAIQEATRV